MRLGSLRTCSSRRKLRFRGASSAGRAGLRERSSRAGFTLLELTIAMTFVAVLMGGITLTISTCLKVWERSQETADLNQEERAVIEVMARDIRGAYLGLHRSGGYFFAVGSSGQFASNLMLEFTTESSAITRAAFSPEASADGSGEWPGPPATDFVAVRYELLGGDEVDRPGLYRTTWVAPTAQWLEHPASAGDATSVELISESVTGLKLRYWNGEKWVDSWESSADNLRLPDAVAVELALQDARGNEHVLESIISLPAR